MRKIMLTGHIVADAEKKVTPTSGREYMTFRLANNEFNDEKGSDGKPVTYWFRVTSWNQNHYNLAKYLTKGKPVIVIGSFSDRIYQNSSGACEISRDIIAESIDFIGGGNSENNNKTNAKTTKDSIPEVTSVPKPKVEENITAVNNNVNSIDDADDLPF